jgi:DNA-binding NarL/FixJ family response regulator
MSEQLKILVVDDHKIFRNTLRITLQKLYSYAEVEEAENGLIFLEKIKEKDFDLVIMDIKMPYMDGITATKKALENDPLLKIICVSAFDSGNDFSKLIDAGFSGFLKKGFGKDEFSIAINKILKGENFFATNCF